MHCPVTPSSIKKSEKVQGTYVHFHHGDEERTSTPAYCIRRHPDILRQRRYMANLDHGILIVREKWEENINLAPIYILQSTSYSLAMPSIKEMN
eukprot:scaffold88144_cov71-Cyclotella_meneghiniana.AAC.2